jgi:hypothetical protein
MKQKILLSIFIFLMAAGGFAQSGEITVTSVQQRSDGSGLVDVYFNLSGTEGYYNIAIQASFNGGINYNPIPPTFLSGDNAGISPGSDKHIVWDGLGSFPNSFTTQAKLELIATFHLNIGDFYQGGIVAYILQPGDPGYIEGELHGLIAAPSDQSAGAQWGCYGTFLGGTSTALGTGAANTAAIVAGCATSGIAARICNDLELNGYTDWYLPSKDELNKLYINRAAIGGFAANYYWSSSESSSSGAWLQIFTNGVQYPTTKDSYYLRVRAVRAF